MFKEVQNYLTVDESAENISSSLFSLETSRVAVYIVILDRLVIELPRIEEARIVNNFYSKFLFFLRRNFINLDTEGIQNRPNIDKDLFFLFRKVFF